MLRYQNNRNRVHFSKQEVERPADRQFLVRERFQCFWKNQISGLTASIVAARV